MITFRHLKFLLIIFFIFTIFLILPNISKAAIVFEDNFDNHPDWTSNQHGTIDRTWPSTGAVTDGGNCTLYCPPLGWTYYGGAKTWWIDDNPRKDTFILDSIGARGSSGKGMTFWHEGAGYGAWADGNMLSKYLGAGYPELYFRFYLKYDPTWTWSDGSSNHGQQKIMRISSYGNGSDQISTSDPMDQYGQNTGGWNSVVWYPYFYYNSSSNTTKFQSGARFAPRYSAGYENMTATNWPSDGQWHMYELYVKLNSSPGVADGKWGFYIDGSLKESRSDIPWVQRENWLPNTAYATGLARAITPTNTLKGYRPIQTGTSGSTEPNWLRDCPNQGDICNDGTIKWQNYTNYNWNHITFLDNMYTSHDINLNTEQAMYFDDAVIYTPMNGNEEECAGACVDGRLPQNYVQGEVDLVAPSSPNSLTIT